MKKIILPFALLFFLTVACRDNASVPETPIPATAVATISPTTNVETAVAPSPTVAPASPTPVPPPATPFAGWPPSAPTRDLFSREPVTALEQATFDWLRTDLPPERDDAALAVAYLGLPDAPLPAPPLVTEPLAVGEQQPIFVNNVDTNETEPAPMTLRHVSDHAYFWFEDDDLLSAPAEAALIDTGVAFDQIYEQVRAIFGPEASPGIDGDPRVHIVNASPGTLCASPNACGLLGYVSSGDMLPTAVRQKSNAREMFVMNGSQFGRDVYLEVLAHEFRHMIEENHDRNDIDWSVEGSAMLAEDLLGFSREPVNRANLFLNNPDQQLNRWSDGATTAYYGQGYLLSRYLYNRLGADLYRDYAQHPLPGLRAVDAIAAANNLSFTGLDLWLDWLAALVIHSEPGADEIYALRSGIETAVATDITAFPAELAETVNQFAADYYRLAGKGAVQLQFAGSNHVPLLDVAPASGAAMWLANRANFSQVHLTREFDLTAVDGATLTYDVFYDIEQGYDFAYVSVSTDGGATWQGVAGEAMRGADVADDPSEDAYTDRFYTGRSSGWLAERIDLTPFAGQVVQVRFEYVTDPILTFGGLAVDNVAIPEIDFYDDAETDRSWTAVGWVRAAGAVPQRWHVLLITSTVDGPVVTPLPLTAANEAIAAIDLDASGGQAVVIVAASSPFTLEPGYYRLSMSRE